MLSLPTFHIGGIMIIFRSLLRGETLILPSNLKLIQAIKEELQKGMINIVSLVPTMLYKLINDGVKPTKTLKYVFLGGDKANKSLIKLAIKNRWNINLVYGLTETTSMVTAKRIAKESIDVNNVGKALPGNKITIEK